MVASKVSEADKKATEVVAQWVEITRQNAFRSMISDPDLRLCAITYDVPGMGTKVITVRDGKVVAWFEDRRSALRDIEKTVS